MKLQNQKQLFNFPEEITYLNIASQSPSFTSIEKAGVDAVIKKSLPYKITTSDYFKPVIELKKLFAKLIDVDDYNRIANIPSVSYGIATVANNVHLNEGDEILLIDEQFPSNYYSWEKLAEKYKATIKFVNQPNTKVDCGKKWNADILNSITNKTALVSIGNIFWANGTVFDLKAIRKKTNQHTALLIIDGSQSVGALPFSVKEINPDALICAGYKWLFGPYGCGYAYYGSYFDHGNPIEENWSNRLNSEDFSKLTSYQPKYKPLANRYSVGEQGSFIYVQMQIAALKKVIEWTPSAIQEYCKEVTSDVVLDLEKLGCYIENTEDRTHHLFGVQLPNTINVDQLKLKLQENNIYISFRGEYIRLSCHVYNTKEDFKKLTNCIASCL
jgi:selenocysteine lyase/cysteine desulfurase